MKTSLELPLEISMNDIVISTLDDEGKLRYAAHLYISSTCKTERDIFCAIDCVFGFPEDSTAQYLAMYPEREDIFNDYIQEMTLKKIKRFNSTKILPVLENMFAYSEDTGEDDDKKAAISAGKSIIDLYVKTSAKTGSTKEDPKSDIEKLLEDL